MTPRFSVSRFSLLSFLGLFLAMFAVTSPAQAQATRTWVSGVGDDANPCSRTAPCKTFAGAISKTAAGGEINCIDPGGFGAVTIVKAITIDCASTVAGVLTAGSNGIIVNAGAADVVALRGLDIIGTVATPGINGIRFIAGGALHVEKCVIREFRQAGTNTGFGIYFETTGFSKLFVVDSVIMNNVSGGVGVRPTGAGGANVSILNTTSTNNGSGFVSDTSAPTSGTIFMSVRNSIAAGNTANGFSAISGATSGLSAILVDHSTSTLNPTGISASGAKAVVLTTGSTIWANNTGLVTGGSAQILSTNNNLLSSVMVDGSFTPPVIALK